MIYILPICEIRVVYLINSLLTFTPHDSLKCAGWGSQKPLANQYVLTETEIAAIQTAVAAYNNKLKVTADAKGLAYVDVTVSWHNVKKALYITGLL